MASAKRSSHWTNAAEVRLCELVVASWNILFGEIKGTGVCRITERRQAKWSDIATKISTEFDVPRTLQQCRKKYQNLKSDSLKKVGQCRHPSTGGGHQPVLGAAERLLAEHLSGREVMEGVCGGFDTDALQEETLDSEDHADTEDLAFERGPVIPVLCSTPKATKSKTAVVTKSTATANCSSKKNTGTVAIVSPSTSRSAVIEGSAKCSSKDSESAAPAVSSKSSGSETSEKCLSKKTTGKRAREELSLTSLTKTNLELDNERLREEIKKIKLERDVLQQKSKAYKDISDLVIVIKDYYNKKNVSDFSSGNTLLDSFFGPETQ